MRSDARLLADQHTVRVDQTPAGLANLPVGIAQQVERVGATEGGIARGKQRADVAEPGGAEDGVDQRVREHVAVRMAGEPPRVIEGDTTEHERHPGLQGVSVDADADPVAHRITSASPSRPSTATAPGGVACR